MFKKYQKTMKVLYATLMFTIVIAAVGGAGIAIHPRTAEAQGLNVPIGTTFDFQSIMKYLKDFVLDKLAYLVAKQILHQMTISVVNWINSGFQGNPSFLNNPAGFFEDAADQVTGNFLVGPLQGLCTPFSLDIRLALATQMTNNGSQGRYTCTLSKVIQAQSLASQRAGNLVNVNVTQGQSGATIGSILNGNILNSPNQLSVNGSSVNGIYNGFTNNFDQDGGWEGWIAMTSEPQNNIYGAYLTAQSDLAQQIAAKKAAINSDLNRGNGFLSWQDCSNVSATQAQGIIGSSGNTRAYQQFNTIQKNNQNQATNNALQNITASPATDALGITNASLSVPQTQNLNIGNGSTIQSSIDGYGNVTYQDCQTKTPGSVIAGTLQASVNSPIVEAELANDINSILNALVSQMVSTMLTKGLSGLSSNGSGKGGNGSYTQSVIADIQKQNNGVANKANNDVRNQLISSATGLQTYKGIYDQAVDAVTGSRDALATAQTCFTTKIASSTALIDYQKTYAQTEITSITGEIAAVDTLLNGLVAKQTDAVNQINQLANATTTAISFGIDDSTDATQALIDQVSDQVDQAKNVTNTSIDANTTVAKGTAQANKDLTDAQKQAGVWTNDATNFQAACNAFPGDAPVPTQQNPSPILH